MPAGANPRYYRMLAVALAIGVVVATILGLTGVTGPGLLELEASIVTLFLASIVVIVVLLFFLVRVGDIFSIEGKLRNILTAEGEKWSASLKAEEVKAEELRQALRRDAAKTNQDVLKETASQRMRIDDANTAAVRAGGEAQSALAQIAELRRRPETSQEVSALKAQVERSVSEMAELKRRDNVNSPLLKELQDMVKALDAEMKQRVKLAEALDVAEKREMEAAATRAGLDAEVTDLRKREQLLTLKARELESKNSLLADAARKPQLTFRDGEEAQHVMLLEGVGNKYAARLNAMGIITIPQLIQARAHDVAAGLHIESTLVEEWQSMARLLPLAGVTPQGAELLARAGIRNAQQLAAQDALDLSIKCKALVAGKKVKTTLDVTPAVAKQWIEAAREGRIEAA